MNVPQLRALREVARVGSVTGAADALGVTQSAVSHALASLESELGLRLVIRDRAGCSLTQIGERLVRHAGEALRHIELLAGEAAAAAGRLSGRLLVGTLPSVRDLLAPLARSFGQRHPLVEVVLLEGTDTEIEQWLGDRTIEAGVVTRPSAGLTTVPLISDSFVAVLPAGHPLAAEADVSLEELTDDPFLLSTGGCELMIQRLYEERGLPLTPNYRVQAMPTLLAMIRQDLGISIVPSLALGGDGGGLATVPLRPAAWRNLLLATRSDLNLNPAARAFLDTVPVASVPPAGHEPPRLQTAARQALPI
jgi:DNA-binding transcriptional LysR family regulator